ncbi:hypothetical protein PR202_gb17710 [Eleusine coracana subsp. coracana]|uniref:Uncharacterized protein n=1 Tax=Eleusine coracana subsp. coracana TaxID=191504 RepID=A0AAV5F1F6_ELECO|nr:hypothetical protein PR202_gb17710 [Eleusine coracana subsp. coracana]
MKKLTGLLKNAAANHGDVTAVAMKKVAGGGKTVWNRRSLGDRSSSSWMPPSPLWNDRRSTATPPPSWV